MRSLKEAIDNLPSGLCYFDRNDILRLCNRTMYRIGFYLTGQELQNRRELDEFLKEPLNGIVKVDDIYILPDQTAWRIRKKHVIDKEKKRWTEYAAFEVTELMAKRRDLEKANHEKRDLMERLEKISENVVEQTREEEILSMKMRIHNELGMSLQATRNFFAQGCPKGEKKQYLREQKAMAKKLRGEVGHTDEVNTLQELKRLAERLDMKIVTQGKLPKQRALKEVLALAIRESMTNTIRHASGHEVDVKISDGPTTVFELTNDGDVPKKPIEEGGGLSSLRDKTERLGGTMRIESTPRFRLILEFENSDYNKENETEERV